VLLLWFDGNNPALVMKVVDGLRCFRMLLHKMHFAVKVLLSFFIFIMLSMVSNSLLVQRWVKRSFSVSSFSSIAGQVPSAQSPSPLASVETKGDKASATKGINFYSAAPETLPALLKEWGQPAFRGTQINQWIFEKGVTDFDDMKDLPKDLRTKLKTFFSVGVLKLVSELKSKDGTRKRAYELQDGQIIESVLMSYEDGRHTACISSQAGCAMGCVFCATGQMGFSRQLTSAEIFEQAQIFSTELKKDNQRLSNVVFMGMGEPLANYDNVLQAVRRINTDLGVGARHITVSTVGLAPRIRKLAEENIQVNLAVSLHQTSDSKRSALMPVNKRYPVAELLDACRFYIQRTNRRISFEWALIKGQTDTEATAHELGRLLQGMLCHVNVIPLNPTDNFGGQPTSKVIDCWCGAFCCFVQLICFSLCCLRNFAGKTFLLPVLFLFVHASINRTASINLLTYSHSTALRVLQESAEVCNLKKNVFGTFGSAFIFF
jgi:23S rRNA (adenine2503-C2)-methyltransferase